MSLKPIIIARTASESVKIEASINSVRLSIALKKSDYMEKLLTHKFTRFLMQRAEHFLILRRRPLPVRERRQHQLVLWLNAMLLNTPLVTF